MNNIISKSSVCPYYIVEGCIVDLWHCYIGQKLTEKEDLAVFAWRDGSFQTIPTSQQGVDQILLYLGKKYNPFNSLRLNPTENIMHNMHKSSIKRELSSTAVNSQINRPGVTLHFLRFLCDFEKGFAEPNALLVTY